MAKLIQIAKLIALLTVVPVAVYFCIFLHQLTATTAELQVTAKTVSATAQTLPGQVDTRLASMQGDVLKKIDTVQDKLNAQVRSVTSTSDNRLASIQTDLVTTLKGVRSDLNTQLTATNKSVDTLVTAYADVPKQVADRYNKDLGSYFDCDQNTLCLQGQASDTLFAIRDASRSTSTTMAGVKDTLPKIEDHVLTITNTFATSVPTITKNFTDITANIDRLTKPKWYDRLLGYGLQGAILYRNINPVTAVSVTGAQTAVGAILK